MACPGCRQWLRKMLRSTLVSALNQDTLAHLDAYVTMCGGDEMARLETIQDRLRRVPYI